ncbi:MAG: MoxR family ATPase [Gordonia sp. (in: high G+C Gram-positive bacteria)]
MGQQAERAAVVGTRVVGESAGRVAEVRRAVAERLVGRERELELVLGAVAAGRDLLLEGPPGTSKTTVLQAITDVWGVPFVLVEGNADLTPARLVGHHDPARVLQEGYSAETFVDGPLVRAMREGGFLYIEEVNRAPDDTLNSVLTAMADRMITVPRAGEIVAAPTFRVVASMNPFDNVGTSRLSGAMMDRVCRLAVDYQSEAEELAIVALRAPNTHGEIPDDTVARLHADAVALTRSTRLHPDVRQGSSVRGAIDTSLIALELLAMRDDEHYPETVWDAMLLGLSGRIHVDEASGRRPEAILREIWEDRFVLKLQERAPG